MRPNEHALRESSACKARSAEFSLDAIRDFAELDFERQLRDIEAGAAALNLGCRRRPSGRGNCGFRTRSRRRATHRLDSADRYFARRVGRGQHALSGHRAAVRRADAADAEPFVWRVVRRDGVERMRSAHRANTQFGSAVAGVIGTSPNDYKPLIYLSTVHLPTSHPGSRNRTRAETCYSDRVARLRTSTRRRIHDLLSAVDYSLRDPWAERASTCPRSNARRSNARPAAPLTIISGGPGTGKTSIVMAILEGAGGRGCGSQRDRAGGADRQSRLSNWRIDSRQLVRRSRRPCAWNACPEPTTVHRLLGYSPTRRRFRHHRNNPLGSAGRDRRRRLDARSRTDVAVCSMRCAPTPGWSSLAMPTNFRRYPRARSFAT